MKINWTCRGRRLESLTIRSISIGSIWNFISGQGRQLATPTVLLSLFIIGGAQAVTIAPPAPTVVVQGQAFQFTASEPVTWSLAPGSLGSIDSNGTYHAPSKIVPNNQVGGCQAYPNNHIFNVPVDQLPVSTMSATWIANTNYGGAAGILIGGDMPVNYVSQNQPTTPMTFYYNPQSNAPFPLPPQPQEENGIYAHAAGGVDRHVIMVDHDRCSEYNIYNINDDISCVGSTCNAQSGAETSLLGFDLPVKGGTDAASMMLAPLLLRPEEAAAGEIRHAFRFTVNLPDQSFVWPSLASAFYGYRSTQPPMGTRFRLRAGFDISTFSPNAQRILRALKNYGIILADAGYGWNIQAQDGDYDRQAWYDIWIKVLATNMEAVDESSLMIDPHSGLTTSGATTVIATSVADPTQSAQAQVALIGATVGVQNIREALQAGTSKQLVAWANGVTNRSLIWTLNPPIGSLSSSGLYTAPSSVSVPQVSTITVTSAVDPSVSATIQVTVLPAGSFRINCGSTATYVDSQGNSWWPDAGYENGTLGFRYNYPAIIPIANTPDQPLYQKIHSSRRDLVYSFQVPNGTYRVTAKLVDLDATQSGQRVVHLEAQGVLIYQNLDIFAKAGGQATALDLDLPATVTDGRLRFAIRSVNNAGSFISGLQITPVTLSPTDPTTTLTPGNFNPQAYPNPWRSDKHGGKQITFAQLVVGGTIKIFTMSGHKVREIPVSATTMPWNLTNDSGDKLASGIYMYLITDGQGNKAKGKLAVIK